MITEIFTLKTQWKTEQYDNIKSHLSIIDGKQVIEVSAAKKLKGDRTKFNPEDLLSALPSCHFMSYQYVCSQAGIELL